MKILGPNTGGKIWRSLAIKGQDIEKRQEKPGGGGKKFSVTGRRKWQKRPGQSDLVEQAKSGMTKDRADFRPFEGGGVN